MLFYLVTTEVQGANRSWIQKIESIVEQINKIEEDLKEVVYMKEQTYFHIRQRGEQEEKVEKDLRTLS